MIHFYSGNDYSTDWAMHARLFSYWYVGKKTKAQFGRPHFKEGVDMKAFMAGYLSFLSSEDTAETGITRSAAPTGILETFYYITPRAQREVAGHIQRPWRTFLDSGGFSAFTQGKSVDLSAYIKYCLDHFNSWDVIAALDVIGDSDASWMNFRLMQKEGIDAIPTFHYGEPWAALDRMVDECNYIAIGGVAQLGGGSALSEWLDAVWANHLIDQDGLPLVDVHGFAITGKTGMLRYPWASVDSSSWLQMAGRGVCALDLPGPEDSVVDCKVAFSERSPSQEEYGKHFDTLAPAQQKAVITYLEELGYVIEDIRRSYRWRQHVNIGYYKRMETRGATRFVREQPGLFF